MQLPLCSNAYDDITDFELWISKKHKNLDITKRNINFFSNKKIQKLHIKGYFLAKNSFLAEVTFKLSETYYFPLV